MLNVPGAVPPPDESIDVGVAWHYGDPLGEQRRLDKGDGFVDMSHRPVISVVGEERLTWLHALTSQHLSALAPGVWTQALVLSPHGHVEHHLSLVDDGEQTLMHVEPGTADALLAYLESMKFWSKVEVAVRDDVNVVWHPGPDGMDGSDRFEFVTGDVQAVVTTSSVQPAGTWAYEALRVAARRPRLGFETDHRTIPAEVDWIDVAVHLDKGCYRGQETVARVHNLGRPPRRLVRLHLDGSGHGLPTTGDALEFAGRKAGFVGTVAQHHELGPIALGLVKRQIPDGETVTTPDAHPVTIDTP